MVCSCILFPDSLEKRLETPRGKHEVDHTMSRWPESEAELVNAMDASHPVLTGRHDLYEKAEALLKYRHSKAAITELVYFLLLTIESPTVQSQSKT